MSFHRIVVAIDAAGWSSDALTTALRAADPFEGRLRLIHVRTWQPSPPPSQEDGFFPVSGGELFTETPQQAADVIDDALRYVRDRGVVADGVVVEAPQPMVASAIVDVASTWGAEVIVVVRRPRQRLSVLLWGSVSEQVTHDAFCPNERLALLFRDWFLAHPEAVSAYGTFKPSLADITEDTGIYADVKDPVVDLVIARGI